MEMNPDTGAAYTVIIQITYQKIAQSCGGELIRVIFNIYHLPQTVDILFS